MLQGEFPGDYGEGSHLDWLWLYFFEAPLLQALHLAVLFCRAAGRGLYDSGVKRY